MTAYAQGRGVVQDYAEAVPWYRKAADQGNAAAQLMLGLMHYQGWGVVQDCAEAARWYLKAAEQSEAGAQYLVGLMYHDGEGVPRDYVAVHVWCNLASASGDAAAARARDALAAEMTPDQLAEAQRLARELKPKIEVPLTR